MGVKVYHNGNWVEFSTGSNASASFIVEEEGTPLVGLATALNFVGLGVTATNTIGNPSTKKIEITGVSTFLQLSDTPATYVGSGSSIVSVKPDSSGLEFIKADSSGLGRDNYVENVTFTTLSGGGAQIKLEYAGPDNFSDITADLTPTTLDLGFTDLTDTPGNYTGHAHKFVRVNKDGSTSNGTALEFVTQIPGTAVGAAGADKQVQFNDGGSTLAGADSLEFVKSGSISSYGLYLKPFSTDSDNYGGGRIAAQTKNNTSTSAPWNRASITADGALELFRTRVVDPVGGPHIDFKSQMGDGYPTGTGQEEDMDARIQMDYANGWVSGQAINPSSADYSSITFQTGGRGYYDSANTNGRVTEKIRIGKYGEIGIQAGRDLYVSETANPPVIANTRTDAQIYGTNGQVLMSQGKGYPVKWSNSSSSSFFSTALEVETGSSSSIQPPASQGATVNLANFRSIAPNAVKLLIYNVRVKYPATSTSANGWEGVGTRIARQIDVTNQAHIQFGANDGSGEQNIHLHTNQLGDIQLQDAKRILLHANKIDFAKLGTATEGGYVGTDYAGMTIVANSGNVSGTTTIDTGISVNQGHGGGVGILFSSRHNDWGTSSVDAQIDMIKFAVGSGPANKNSVPTRSNIVGGSVPISVSKSPQNTLWITMTLGNYGGRWALMMMGGNCVDAFTVDV